MTQSRRLVEEETLIGEINAKFVFGEAAVSGILFKRLCFIYLESSDVQLIPVAKISPEGWVWLGLRVGKRPSACNFTNVRCIYRHRFCCVVCLSILVDSWNRSIDKRDLAGEMMRENLGGKSVTC